MNIRSGWLGKVRLGYVKLGYVRFKIIVQHAYALYQAYYRTVYVVTRGLVAGRAGRLAFIRWNGKMPQSGCRNTPREDTD